MPPKRRAPPASNAPKPPPRSKLAKENSITNAQEQEIREAFALFALKVPHAPDPDDDDENADEVLGAGRRRQRGKGKGKGKAGEEEEMLRREDVRRCLIALNLHPKQAEVPEILSTLDPTPTGFVSFDSFITYAALMLNNRSSESPDPDASDDEASQQEVAEAWKLFTKGHSGPITIAHLRRIAKELREEVPDELLKDMILIANGEAGEKGVRKGVRKDEFEEVMKRAGVFS